MAKKIKRSIERERKFLVREMPQHLSRFPHSQIRQGYLARTDDQIEVRVRKKGREHTIGIKKGGGSVRIEEEIKISKREFETLWPLTSGKRIDKIRYEIAHQGLTIEVDIYKGPLRGLATAEVEFKSAADSKNFKPPGWIGEDVTKRDEYKNWSLALFGIPGKNEGNELRHGST